MRPKRKGFCQDLPSLNLHASTENTPLDLQDYEVDMYILSKPTYCHKPVWVFKVRLVCFIFPPRRDPDSADPLATGRDRRLSPANTVKLARGRSQGLRVATLGEPGQTYILAFLYFRATMAHPEVRVSNIPKNCVSILSLRTDIKKYPR